MNVKTTCSLLLVAIVAFGANALEDPTRPPLHAGAQVLSHSQSGSALRLSSVLIAPERRVAIIDGQAYSEGETRGGVTVTRIAHDGVDVVVGGRSTTLRLQVAGFSKEEHSR